ncbi:MAG: hypothetical protein AAF802_00255 [Planctomycetota bacterium]
MQTKSKLIGGVGVVASIMLATVITFAGLANAQDHKHDSHGKNHDHAHAMKMTKMTHIKTRAEAEALKPGDSIAMVCSMCKIVTVYPVGNDKSHVEMMTVGNTHTCSSCSGKVTVKGTGKAEGRHQEVKHVCGKCGEDAMFVVATKAGDHEKHRQHK